MKIAVPTEVKNNENRVALTPAGADRLVHEGHRVLVQSGAGLGSRISDDDYRAVGAEILDTAEEVWGDAELLIKVKEPTPAEYGFLRDDLTLFTYLHLAADRALTTALVDAGTTAVAYETVQLPDRSLPLLVPMSEIAGRLSVTMGSYSLLRSNGGRGMLLGGIAGALGFRHLGFVFVVPLAVVLCLLSLPPLWADRARLPLLLGRRAAPRGSTAAARAAPRP